VSDGPDTQSTTTESNAGTPVASPPVTAAPAPQTDFSKHFESLSTSLSALPELIAKSVQEAVGKATPPVTAAKETTTATPPAKEQTTTTTTTPPKESTPGRRGWDGGKWWFS
jgi:hypothetical protein